MLDVLADVGLEQDRLAFSQDATAIDEVLRDVSDFRDVRMRRDVIAVRQDKPRKTVRMTFEERAKIREFHSASIFQLRNIIKRAKQKGPSRKGGPGFRACCCCPN